jgi:hypothetical protein
MPPKPAACLRQFRSLRRRFAGRRHRRRGVRCRHQGRSQRSVPPGRRRSLCGQRAGRNRVELLGPDDEPDDAEVGLVDFETAVRVSRRRSAPAVAVDPFFQAKGLRSLRSPLPRTILIPAAKRAEWRWPSTLVLAPRGANFRHNGLDCDSQILVLSRHMSHGVMRKLKPHRRMESHRSSVRRYGS